MFHFPLGHGGWPCPGPMPIVCNLHEKLAKLCFNVSRRIRVLPYQIRALCDSSHSSVVWHAIRYHLNTQRENEEGACSSLLARLRRLHARHLLNGYEYSFGRWSTIWHSWPRGCGGQRRKGTVMKRSWSHLHLAHSQSVERWRRLKKGIKRWRGTRYDNIWVKLEPFKKPLHWLEGLQTAKTLGAQFFSSPSALFDASAEAARRHFTPSCTRACREGLESVRRVVGISHVK